MKGFQTDRPTEKNDSLWKKNVSSPKFVFIGTHLLLTMILFLSTNPCKVAVNEKNVSSLTPPDVVVFSIDFSYFFSHWKFLTLDYSFYFIWFLFFFNISRPPYLRTGRKKIIIIGFISPAEHGKLRNLLEEYFLNK